MKEHAGNPAIRLFAALLAMLLAAGMAGCQTATPAGTAQPQNSAAPAEPGAAPTFGNEITIDYYQYTANYQGILGGWLGKAIKDKFNMKVNIIAPNIGGQAIFQTRSAAGFLGDIVILDTGSLKDVVKAGLLMELTDLVKNYGGNLTTPVFAKATESLQKSLGTDEIYALPSDVSSLSPVTPLPSYTGAMGCTQSGGAVYLRYDLYTAIGSPEMKTMEDLLGVMQQMQEMYPTSISGKKTYGCSLFKDWDGAAMTSICASFPSMYGYNVAPGTTTILTYGDPTEFKTERLDADDGLYYRSLKFYFQAAQMGLMDPDSPSQNWDTVCAKMADGQILYYWWPWASMAQYNNKTNGNADPPTGFEFVPVNDMKYFDAGYNPFGQWGAVTCIGSKAKEPERLMAFINWVASPEGEETLINGPKGLMWDIVNGEPVLTDFGKQAQLDDSIAVPEEYGGGTVHDDANASYNYIGTMLFYDETDPNTGTPYRMNLWPSVMSDAATKLDKAWQAAFKANDMLDYIKQHGMMSVAPGNGFVAPTDSGDIQNERNQCGKIVTDTSWQMVFAKDQATFDSLWMSMKEQIKGLGWEDVLAVDMQTAKDYNAACMETINNSK
jgi:putative aldouronate transport system substrate-binding protein